MVTAPSNPPWMTIRMVDGSFIPQVSIPMLTTFRPDCIMGLFLPSIDPLSVDFLPTLFSKPMPFLKQLSITVHHHTDAEAICPRVPTLDLSAELFPSLELLYLDGVVVNMRAPFLPSLKQLTLKNYPGVGRRLLLVDFMAALESCTALEKLEIRGFGHIMSFDSEEPDRPAALAQLKKVVIAEPPGVASFLLEWFSIPPTAAVHVYIDMKGFYDVDVGRTFASFLPENVATLPILTEMSKVAVSLDKNTVRLSGESPRKGSLVLETDMDFEVMIGAATGAQLYEAIVRDIGLVFYNSPISAATFTGDLSYATLDTWRGLSALTKLMKLDVEDTGPRSDGLRTLFKTLATPVQRQGWLWSICPNLAIISARGAAYEAALLDEASRLLTHRASAGMKIHALTLEMKSAGAHVRASDLKLGRYEADFKGLVISDATIRLVD